MSDRSGGLRAQSARALVVTAATLLVVTVAAGLTLAGVDRVEVGATVLFIPVFAAALVAGRAPGLVVAGVATLVYTAARRPDLDATGIPAFAILGLVRGAAYAVAAEVGLRAEGVVESLAAGNEWDDSPLVARGRAQSRRHQPILATYVDEPAWPEPAREPVLASVGAGSAWGPPPGPPAYDTWAPPTGAPAWAPDPEPVYEQQPYDAPHDEQPHDEQPYQEQPYQEQPYEPRYEPFYEQAGPPPGARPARSALPPVDPETRLSTASYLCDRIAADKAECDRTGRGFSLVLVQVPDEPLALLPYRRQVTLLRELGHQFVAGGVVDHLVHVPDQSQHWFAVVVPDADPTAAQVIERRLRAGIGGYLRSRGVPLVDLESASLTAPDDDPAMDAIWQALVERGDPALAR
ncbi:MAG: hypothetical protein ACRDZN_08735 [Acidimicrobiales bacterium]